MPHPLPTQPTPQALADALRVLCMDAVEAAGSGHPGMPMGMADVATTLFTRVLKFDPKRPDWPDRDRFVLSNGHGSVLLYALLHLTGYEALTMGELRRLRRLDSLTPGHPEYGHTPGVETTTGPLGQGLATAVGMAMAERRLNAEFGDALVDHRTWVFCGDGDLMEGVSHEAASIAGRLRLKKLSVIWDDNEITIEGPAHLSETGDPLARMKASGWAVKRIDGHDFGQIERALSWAKRQDRPTLIAARTRIGKGSANLEGHHDTHGKTLGKTEVAATRQKLNWIHEPFELPEPLVAAWREAGARGAATRQGWEARAAAHPNYAAFDAQLAGDLPDDAFDKLDAVSEAAARLKPAHATREASGHALAALTPDIPAMVGGSADLTGSNNTLVRGMGEFDAPAYAGRYVRYGVREFGMAAAMNGMAAHGGIIPYGGTFLVFSDYARPALRLAALMKIRVIHVLTHDSIGVGEDGPTHQPVEHLAALRAIPDLHVFRPCDAVETAECWKAALLERSTPSLLALSRQKTPGLRAEAGDKALRGAYQLAPADGQATVTLFSTGTEVAIAMTARERLQARGVGARVVSMPCWSLFERQDEAYRRSVLGASPVKVAIEAGLRFGWDRYIGSDGLFIGMQGFGLSGAQDQLYSRFGITAEATVDAVLARLNAGKPNAAAA